MTAMHPCSLAAFVAALTGACAPGAGSFARPATVTESPDTRDEFLDSMTSVPEGVEKLQFVEAVPDPGPIEDALRRSAAHDLPCTEKIKLASRSLHGSALLFTADGCGQRVTYLLESWDKSHLGRGLGWLAHFVLIARVALPSSS